jgi:hypothetical protein
MKVFNAFQLVIMLCIWPHLISRLNGAEFRGHDVAFWLESIFILFNLDRQWRAMLIGWKTQKNLESKHHG